MKNLKLKINSRNIRESTRLSIFWSVVAYSKLYELIHKQLWRKGRVYTEDYTVTVNNRPAKPIKIWNIKSPSTAPYERDDFNNLGLNQLFMGQDPYKPYEGDPKDGIYHDDCYIQPKNIYKLPNLNLWGKSFLGKEEEEESDLLKDIPIEIPMSGWSWNTDVLGNSTKINEYDDWGNKLVESVVKETGDDEIYALITYTNGSIEKIQMTYDSPITYYTDSTTYSYVPLSKYTDSFGQVIFREDTTATVMFTGEAPCTFFVFANGLAFYLSGKNDTRQTIRKFAPLVYTDTGDLVMSKILFIDYWEDLFELYIHENSEWYQSILGFVIIVSAFVLAFITQYYPLIALGISADTAMVVAVIAGIGASAAMAGGLMGDKTLQVIGMVLTLGTSVYTGYIGSTQVTKEIVRQSVTEAAKNTTVKAVVEYAFTDMLPEVLLQLFSLYKILESNVADSTPTAEAEETSNTSAAVSEEEYIDDVMMIARQHEVILNRVLKL